MATTAIRFELKNFLVPTAAESSAESSQSTTRIQPERETEREMSSGARSRHRQAVGRMKISYKVSYNFLFHSQKKNINIVRNLSILLNFSSSSYLNSQ